VRVSERQFTAIELDHKLHPVQCSPKLWRSGHLVLSMLASLRDYAFPRIHQLAELGKVPGS